MMSEIVTEHRILIGNACEQIATIEANTVGLVVTSPPYPMIEMWDEIMSAQNSRISKSLINENGLESFELMHKELDKVWTEVERIVLPGGFVCINIGDATRTISDKFCLYNNHSRIISKFIELGFLNMPNIIWRKQTNAPNKFMGSGMLPAGAYVTLEHEWILIFRKGGKRVFKNEEQKRLRRESAFFWEERNTWFSDQWDLKGVKQKIENSDTRSRSAAYPFEIPYRLINMYSVKGDTIFDPFLGTGTSTLAAIASERNSIGVEIDPSFLKVIEDNIYRSTPEGLNRYISNRVESHKRFIVFRDKEGKDEMKHFNIYLNLPVMTSQEIEMKINFVESITGVTDIGYTVIYKPVAKNNDLAIKRPSKHGKQELLNF
ncbi:site-specific DNA-methyltransferase [Mucilaginibacter sp. 14171R-50]|uniref:DNA-methyltransferase n=1 Tax=Mucilaginibacter sp. 14171R-50 TaxID=2703789 RepID=UPI00192EA69A|nr:site-specific DNA-methyltransferase [Mucilaginibacter sp. 14171R-50]